VIAKLPIDGVGIRHHCGVERAIGELLASHDFSLVIGFTGAWEVLGLVNGCRCVGRPRVWPLAARLEQRGASRDDESAHDERVEKEPGRDSEVGLGERLDR
tara:strand:+ start:293 stop:595 length:303 start_codon:yes stop_codon:yes gene_type:complete